MNTNRLSQSICAALNAQMTKEAHAAQIYLSYACWASAEGYNGIANFLFRHAQEERNHMMKILEYILQRGGTVSVQAIPDPGAQPVHVQDCFEKIFYQEIENSKGIYQVVKLSFNEEDWATWNFMQWFVKEQTEEEAMAMELLDRIKISGGASASGEALYSLDKDLESTPDEVATAEEKTADNP